MQGMNPTVIRFQVWRRRRRGSGYFDVVGENIYPGYDAVKHIVVFDVNEADRISVQPGDIIGAYVEAEGDRDDYKMVLHESSLYDSVQVYLIEVEDQLVESFSFSRDPLSDNPLFEVINGSAPLLRATVEAGNMKGTAACLRTLTFLSLPPLSLASSLPLSFPFCMSVPHYTRMSLQ